MSGEAQLFDVREPGEAANGMLTDAQLVPLSELQQVRVAHPNCCPHVSHGCLLTCAPP